MTEINHDSASIRRLFFTYRNGIIADTLRKAGAPHNTIFGLQLPQIKEIAGKIGVDTSLGKELWNEEDCRESRLLACWLINPAELSTEEILDIAKRIRTREEADILAFKVLRYVADPDGLAELMDGEPEIDNYSVEALRRNLN